MNEFTRILERVESGDSSAAAGFLPVIYDELRRLAARQMVLEKPGQTLQATALVHEAWIRLSESNRQEWRGRGHFFGAAAEAMRRILVENARRKQRVRHGGGMERVDCELVDLPIAADDDKCLHVHEALDRLSSIDPRKADVVKMRIFIGMEIQEIALVLELSEKSIQRDWNFAKAWLSRELKSLE